MCAVARGWVECGGRELHLEGAPSLLLTHSMIISFFVFLLPHSFFSSRVLPFFLLSFYVRFLLHVIYLTSDSGAGKLTDETGCVYLCEILRQTLTDANIEFC